MVGVGEGVMLGEGIKLVVAVGPKISAGLRLQALSSRAELHNPRRSFLKFIGLLIMGKGGVVKLNPILKIKERVCVAPTSTKSN